MRIFKKHVVWLILMALIGGACLGATPLNVWFTGPNGPIPGDSIKSGREGSSDVFGYSHTLFAEPDSRFCVTSDTRNHFPISLIKEVDIASPLLHQVWRDNAPLQVTIKFYRIDPATREEVEYYRVELIDAFISDIRKELPMSFVPANAPYMFMERVSLSYTKITETWLPDAIVYEARWSANCDKTSPFYDYNFDGEVDFLDFELMADRWLDMQ